MPNSKGNYSIFSALSGHREYTIIEEDMPKEKVNDFMKASLKKRVNFYSFS